MTGQKKATLDLEKTLQGKGWQVTSVETPSFRPENLREDISLFFKVLSTWAKTSFSRIDLVQVNLGQSIPSFLREGLLWFLIGYGKPCSKKIISLHGHWFTEWGKNNIRRKILLFLCRRSTCISVLGPVQKETLKDWGIPESKIKVIDNATDLPAISYKELCDKHNRALSVPVQVTFLSNMIPSKGYIEFLEAMRIVTQKNADLRWEITIAGRWVNARFSKHTLKESGPNIVKVYASKFSKMPHVNFEFHEGVNRDEKLKILRGTHIFVLPSYQEAQPMVLIEAMSQGIAIITTHIGEIPAMFSENSVTFTPLPVNPENLAEKIVCLARSPKETGELAFAARKCFESRYTWDCFEIAWESLLS